MTERPRGSSGVQSLERALRLLELLADAGGTARLSDLAAASGLPMGSIHRLMKTFVATGYVRQEPSRTYALGPKLVHLGETAGRLLGSWSTPLLADVVAEVGETSNLAMLEGDGVVYVAQVPSKHSTRMFTEVGRRVPAHSTGVGKALLSQLPDEAIRALIEHAGMPAFTDRTLASFDALMADLALVRDRGYAVDDGEFEVGVRCVAVPVPQAPGLLAISTSGPAGRLTTERVEGIARVLRRVADRLPGRMGETAS